jgi:hypothetical protein
MLEDPLGPIVSCPVENLEPSLLVLEGSGI